MQLVVRAAKPFYRARLVQFTLIWEFHDVVQLNCQFCPISTCPSRIRKQTHPNKASNLLCYPVSSLCFPGLWFSCEKGSLIWREKWIIGLLLAKKDTHQSDVNRNPLQYNTYRSPNQRANSAIGLLTFVRRAKNNLRGQSCIFYDLINRRNEKTFVSQTSTSDLS